MGRGAWWVYAEGSAEGKGQCPVPVPREDPDMGSDT